MEVPLFYMGCRIARFRHSSSALAGAEFAMLAPARCIGLFGESPALPERRRRKFPPGNAQATGRQILGAFESRRLRRDLESGVPLIFGSTHRRGAARNGRLISQVTGQMGGTCTSSAAFCFGGPVGRRTPLFELHQELGARIVDFGGWDMPVQYASQIGEHHAVRRAAGIFDVSHMCAVDLKGPRVRQFLQHLLANDVAKLKLPGKALYSCM